MKIDQFGQGEFFNQLQVRGGDDHVAVNRIVLNGTVADASFGCRHGAGDYLEQGGFSGTVGAGYGNAAARREVDRQAAEDPFPDKPFFQVVRAEAA